jgi:hypothetical protein
MAAAKAEDILFTNACVQTLVISRAKVIVFAASIRIHLSPTSLSLIVPA